MQHRIDTFDDKIKQSVDYFLKLAKDKRAKGYITVFEYDQFTSELIALKRNLLDKYHEAQIEPDPFTTEYLEKFQTTLSQLRESMSTSTDFELVLPHIEQLVEAAKPPVGFADKLKPAAAILAGFLGAVLGFIAGATIGALIGGVVGALVGLVAIHTPPTYCAILFFSVGVCAVGVGLNFGAAGAKAFHQKAADFLKKPATPIEEHTHTIFKSEGFSRLFQHESKQPDDNKENTSERTLKKTA